MFILDRSQRDPLAPGLLLRPAFGEFARRMARMPQLLALAAIGCLGRSPGRGFSESLMWLARGLPTGLFDNDAIATYLSRLLSQPGRTNDFRKLARKLFIVATDLDSGRSAPFGSPGFDDVPISEAVKASAALPGLYPPVRIGDRDYVDGALKKTLHASVALKAGAKLLICINPIVPYNGELAAQRGGPQIRLADRGLLTVLSQTFRALVHSRMTVGMERYAKEFPDADVVLFEPAQDDAVIFFANIFSYSDRRRLADHAYRHTLAELSRRADELEPILCRHGIELDRAVLANFDKGLQLTPSQTGALWDSVAPLERTLSRLERALRGQGRKRSQGTKHHGAKAAPTNA
jgi:predicted acylesterase/phospholipase RssA